jgi:tRNA G18 (ribose-2'-O)-methylase SpoU
VTAAAAKALEPSLPDRPRPPVHLTDPVELRETTGYDFHRGCLALAWRGECALTIDELAHGHRLLALEGVGNPDNVGGLFRSAFAFGVDAMLLDPATGDPLYRKAIRTSMAATLRVPFTRAASWPGVLSDLRARGHRIVALTPHPDAVTLESYHPDREARLVLVAGSEGDGLSRASMACADVKVRIPIDPRADSLNVVVATSIVLQRLSSERR